jgi:putative chitinase
MITSEQLKQIAPYTNESAASIYPELLNELMPRYDINTPERIAAFIAQLAHESGSFRYVREIASGAAYEGRKDLGNLYKGDGKKFKGRGLIQVTGRGNYLKCSMALFGDDRLIHNPEILATPRYAVESACWFWKSNSLNKYADSGDFKGLTKRINGGLNGWIDRQNFFKRATQIFK